jgi:hypothetical protein
MILAVLGSIVFGLATPSEAAAVGSFGGFALAAIYALLKLPPEKRRKILAIWIPLWLLVALSIVWFILLKFEVLETEVPVWVGWVSIGAAALWCVVAVFQVKLQQTVKESVFLTAKDVGDGLLALCRLVDIFGGVCAARRPGSRRALGALARPHADPVHDPRADHHLPARLAARVDRDHRHFHADLHPAARRSFTSTRCSSGSWWRSTCRRRSSPRRWRWRRST